MTFYTLSGVKLFIKEADLVLFDSFSILKNSHVKTDFKHTLASQYFHTLLCDSLGFYSLVLSEDIVSKKEIYVKDCEWNAGCCDFKQVYYNRNK